MVMTFGGSYDHDCALYEASYRMKELALNISKLSKNIKERDSAFTDKRITGSLEYIYKKKYFGISHKIKILAMEVRLSEASLQE
jgi:hypothetical protein